MKIRRYEDTRNRSLGGPEEMQVRNGERRILEATNAAAALEHRKQARGAEFAELFGPGKATDLDPGGNGFWSNGGGTPRRWGVVEKSKRSRIESLRNSRWRRISSSDSIPVSPPRSAATRPPFQPMAPLLQLIDEPVEMVALDLDHPIPDGAAGAEALLELLGQRSETALVEREARDQRDALPFAALGFPVDPDDAIVTRRD